MKREIKPGHPDPRMEAVRQRCIRLSKERLRASVGPDSLIIQAIGAAGDLDRSVNLLSKRLREWFELYNPELSRQLPDNEALAAMAGRGLETNPGSAMGSRLSSMDREAIKGLALCIASLCKERSRLESYIDTVMKASTPNLREVAGSQVGSKLIAQAGSLKRLASMTSGTLQLLGAEKALFRHMRTGARAPKHGIILQHQLIQAQPAAKRGRAARVLSDKISIAARVDYFKGEFIGKRLRQELEGRLKCTSPAGK